MGLKVRGKVLAPKRGFERGLNRGFTVCAFFVLMRFTI